MLHSPHSTLGPYIRYIQISILDPNRFNPTWLKDALPWLGRTLTNVRSLRLSGINWHEMDCDAQRAFLLPFDGRITSLEVFQIKFEAFSHFVDLIFPPWKVWIFATSDGNSTITQSTNARLNIYSHLN